MWIEIPFKTPRLLKTLIPSAEWSVNTSKKEIYLTFDDGPIPSLTESILDILNQFDAKATFFCVGDNIRKYPEIFSRTIREGHSIGNHTHHHVKGWQLNTVNYLHEVEECQHHIDRYYSLHKKKLFRPPYGQIKPAQMRALKNKGYKLILWDILSKDYDLNVKSDKILAKCLRNTEKGTIVVFHDNYKAEKNVLSVLPSYINHFQGIGYKFNAL